MSDPVLLILVFLLGAGVGGLLVNELAWRSLRRDLAKHRAHRDAEMARLKERA